MFVYLLLSEDERRSYVGATVDVERRLKQHNRQLSGGAKYTANGTWKRVCYLSGFEDWTAVLQFEWKWKQLTRLTPKAAPLQRRLEALNVLLAQGFSTKKSTPFNLEIHEE